MTSSLLASTLGFKPLDRLQINSVNTIRDMTSGQRLYDLPFLFFQYARPDGLLEVCTPGGYTATISPLDICDVIDGKPLIVRAMPRNVFMDRSRLAIADRQARPGPECYAPAYVVKVSKDRWNRVDQTFVWFIDAELNGDSPIATAIHDEDRSLVVGHARRTNMPVICLTKGNYSADQGVAQENDLARDIAARFIRESRRGNTAAAEVMSMAGFRKVTRSRLNRLPSMNSPTAKRLSAL